MQNHIFVMYIIKNMHNMYCNNNCPKVQLYTFTPLL